MTALPDTAASIPPRLCARCRLRPARYPEGGICIRCSKGNAPRPLEGFDPATALPPVELPNRLADARELNRAAKEARKEAARIARETRLAALGRPPDPPPSPTPEERPTPALTFHPFPEGAPAAWPAWAVPYLVAVATIGGRTKAAYDVGVKPRHVKTLRDNDDVFRETEADAQDYFADALAVELPNSKTPIGRIARLKSLRPVEYETALIVQNVTNNTLAVSAAAGAAEALMEDFFAQLDERRVKMLRGEVLDVPADVIVESLPA